MKILTPYTRIYYLAVILSVIAVSAVVAALEEKPREGISNEFVVGSITISPPEEYVIIEDVKSKKKRLYEKAQYEKIKEDKNVKFVQTILIDTIEYRYNPIEGKVKFASNLFEFVELDEKKAILKRDYAKESELPITDEPEPLMEEELTEEMPEIEEEAIKETEKAKTGAKRLIASLFYKIESKEISDTEWEISLPSILDSAGNFAHVLGLITKKVADVIEPEKTAKLYISTSIGKGALGPEGLLIESLSTRLKAKCGIKDDDLITSVNGKTLSALQDVSAIFSSLDPATPHTIVIRLVRDDSELTHTYYIK
ncbi:MAG: hypothetical protein ISS34_01675 [Candidatus Omnitrophica bacterium]|nr:hypothetical protein [Candidatus Omnitrophota bacterium]